MSEEFSALYHLGVALAIGLLVGVERGWQGRKQEEGERVAGVRTYGLIGLLGGCSALLSNYVGPLALGLMFVGMTGVFTTVYVVNRRPDDSVGITSLITGLLTFSLGALAVLGEITIAAAAAVVLAMILSYKPLLHRWVNALKRKELHAGIKLLLISVVVLPALPNRGFGPWEALNPYTIWWMVVLVASISFIGYFAVKIGGPQRGTVFTGLFGGLASSTALTLHFSRLSRQGSSDLPILAIGILLACGTMFPRMMLIAVVLNPYLFLLLIVPAVAFSILTFLPIVYYWKQRLAKQTNFRSPLKNPLEMKAALIFGAILSLVMLAGEALRQVFGDAGLLAFAGASGVINVDAVTLLLSRMSRGGLTLQVAAQGMVIAAMANNLTKAGMATVIGGKRLGLYVGVPLVISGIGGAALSWYWVSWFVE